MNQGQQPAIAGRTLVVDGDGLCYYCAGNDETSPGMARRNLLDKVEAARVACGAEDVMILLTARGSHKGHRYAVATVKPYQGQRTDSRRPNNWEFLRGMLEDPTTMPQHIHVMYTTDAEADDLFARFAKSHPDCVIYTQDKDMRMITGTHLDWLTHVLVTVPAGTWSMSINDKMYGRAWFWSQMLHGDAADNIPGLPFYTTGELVKSGPNKGKVKEIRCGEASTAVKEMLPEVHSDLGATLLLQQLYTTCYGDRWLVHMLEQGILLWLRSDQNAALFDVIAPGNPLQHLTTHELFGAAKQEIVSRLVNNLILESDGAREDQEAVEDTGGGQGVYEEVAPSEPRQVQLVRPGAQPEDAEARPRAVHAGEQQDAGEEARRAPHNNEGRHSHSNTLPNPRPTSGSWGRRLIAAVSKS
jgi:hypothetical protein